MRIFAALFLSAFAVSALADPPGRVGRISIAEGEVIFSQESADPAPAVINTPVTGGESLRTGEAARAEVQIGSLTLHLGDNSRLHFVQLDDEAVRVYLVHGALIARIRDDPLEFELSGPGLAIAFPRTGSYRLDVDGGIAAVAVREGEAQVTRSTGERFTVSRNETARIGQGGERHTIRTSVLRDRLDEWANARLEQEDRSAASRYLSRELTGYQDLDDYGSWEETVEYGPVWVPYAIHSGWAPYRDGHWSFVHPWGWTWIDHAPWGFAPFHYGRWTHRHKVWCWVPGPFVKRPHFAPALVAFGDGHKHHDVPKVWHPLAPHHQWKPSHPSWHQPAATAVNPPARLAPTPHAAANAAQAGLTQQRGMRLPRGARASAPIAGDSRGTTSSPAVVSDHRPPSANARLPAAQAGRGLSASPSSSTGLPHASLRGGKTIGDAATVPGAQAPAANFRSNGRSMGPGASLR
jgi:hypothetical protein